MLGSPSKYLTPILPPYSGPYTVGSVEVEIKAPWPAKYDAIGTSVETLLFRVFYPGKVDEGKKPEHPYWFPGGNREYIKRTSTTVFFCIAEIDWFYRLYKIFRKIFRAWLSTGTNTIRFRCGSAMSI